MDIVALLDGSYRPANTSTISTSLTADARGNAIRVRRVTWTNRVDTEPAVAPPGTAGSTRQAVPVWAAPMSLRTAFRHKWHQVVRRVPTTT